MQCEYVQTVILTFPLIQDYVCVCQDGIFYCIFDKPFLYLLLMPIIIYQI